MQLKGNKFFHSRINDGQQVSSSQIASLQNTIFSFLQENKKKLQNIYQIDPFFSYSLYKPADPVGIQKVFLKPLMLKQIDRLMDESDMLAKKQQQISLKSMEHNYAKQSEIEKSANHFMVLRSAWTKFSQKNISTEQHVDNLNKVVGMIRNNINHLIQQQQKSIDTEYHQYQTSFTQKQQQKQRQELERLSMQNQDLKTQLIALKHKISQKDQKIYELQRKIKGQEESAKKTHFIITQNQCSMLALEGQKTQMEQKIKQLSFQLNKLNTKYSNSHIYQSQQYKIIIQCSTTINHQARTSRKLTEVLQFLNDKENLQKPQQSQIIIPELALPTTFTERKYGLSERIHAKTTTNKYISMKTPRKSSNKSLLFTSGTNEPNEEKNKKFMRTSRVSIPDRNKFQQPEEFNLIDSL